MSYLYFQVIFKAWVKISQKCNVSDQNCFLFNRYKIFLWNRRQKYLLVIESWCFISIFFEICIEFITILKCAYHMCETITTNVSTNMKLFCIWFEFSALYLFSFANKCLQCNFISLWRLKFGNCYPPILNSCQICIKTVVKKTEMKYLYSKQFTTINCAVFAFYYVMKWMYILMESLH